MVNYNKNHDKDDKMKILFINDNHEHVGGAETYLFTVMSSLKKKDIETNFFSMNSEKKYENENLKVYQDIRKNRLMDHFCRNYFNPYLYHELRKWIRKINPDVIHLNNISRYQNSIILAAMKEKVPLVQTVHDIRAVCPAGTGVKINGEVCTGSPGLKCLLYKCIRIKSYTYLILPWKIRKLLNRSAIRCFIVVSNRFKEILDSNGLRNVIFIPFFIDYKKYRYNQSKENRNELLYVGSLIDIKGLQYLIKSMPVVLEKFPETILHIVGDGSEKMKYKKTVKDLRIENNVVFHGKIPNDQVYEFYQKANIVLVPSVCMDQFPLVGLEALASGVPVIGSKIGGIPEWLEDGKTGFLVEPGNAESISNNLIKILSDSNLAKTMAENARKRAENWPGQEEYANKLIEIYEKIMS